MTLFMVISFTFWSGQRPAAGAWGGKSRWRAYQLRLWLMCVGVVRPDDDWFRPNGVRRRLEATSRQGPFGIGR